jgi:hypothetical protein
MNQNPSSEIQERWSRPQLERSRPIRTAEGARPGVGGVPLIAAQDAVVAAVRMAYRVAEAQIDRSTRLARRLREAGDRAVGARSDLKAVDATEQLIFRAVMAALAWLEGLADERDPVRRLMAAQYRMAGSMFGLTPSGAPGSSRRDAPDGAPRSADATPASRPQPGGSTGAAPPIKVILKGDKRPVRIKRYDVESGAPRKIPGLEFFSEADIENTPKADLAIEPDGHASIEFAITRAAKPGVWKAAVCDAEDVQIGVIEIEI